MISTIATPIVRRSARAVLIDDDGQLVTIKRAKVGSPPYWTTPGGGFERQDVSLEAALLRELLEELGAVAIVGQRLTMVSTPVDGGESVQYFFAARLIGIDESLRTGDEHTDPKRGTYQVQRIRLDQLADIDLRPTVVKTFIEANTAALLADLPLEVVS